MVEKNSIENDDLNEDQIMENPSFESGDLSGAEAEDDASTQELLKDIEHHPEKETKKETKKSIQHIT